MWRTVGELKATQAMNDLLALKLTIREDMDISFWKNVGKLKAQIKRISLADCFAIALAQKTEAPLLTSDHHEFDPILPMNLCSIQFIR